MKKLLLIIGLGVAATGFTSCNKNYTCECKNNYSGEILVGNIMTSSGKEARKHCAISDPQSAPYYTCQLK